MQSRDLARPSVIVFKQETWEAEELSEDREQEVPIEMGEVWVDDSREITGGVMTWYRCWDRWHRGDRGLIDGGIWQGRGQRQPAGNWWWDGGIRWGWGQCQSAGNGWWDGGIGCGGAEEYCRTSQLNRSFGRRPHHHAANSHQSHGSNR